MSSVWQKRPGDVIIRRPLVKAERIVKSSLRLARPATFWSPLTLFYGFAGLIGIGALLLSLPVSTQTGQLTPPVDALFTATSAAAVTGLAVVDTGTYWSPFGQTVILALIQLGGLGFMTSSTLLFLIIGRRITLRERLLIRAEVGVDPLSGLVRLARRILIYTFVIEGIGAVLLARHFQINYSFENPFQMGVFHAVSAFNNCGLDLFGNFQSLKNFQGDAVLLLEIALLIFLGGISFTVMADVVRTRRFGRLTLDSRLVLTVTVLLLLVGAVVFFLSEYDNPSTIREISLPEKFLNSVFFTVAVRTAGFSSVDIGQMKEYTQFFTTILMFIGGASGSTAGGIKVNTFGLIAVAILSALRRKEQVEAFQRVIPEDQLRRGLVIVVMALALIFAALFFLTITETFSFLELFFETVSAFATCGLSTGITPSLTPWGKLILIITMYLGRLGPLALALTLAAGEIAVPYRYAQERIKIG